MISKSSIEQLKAVVDIVDVISYYLPLKKNGANYTALCPFHDEKTPSFSVSAPKQIYHCFGCGAGGDAIKFVMEYEKLDYKEAIEKLATIFNFTLSYEKGSGGRDFSKVLDQINNFFKHELFNNQKALDYLKSRGISESSIEKFEIGFAPSSAKFMNFLQNKSLLVGDVMKAGVIINTQKGYYFRFEDRLMFPIFTPFGKLVGFGGRTLGEHQAKYLNSPQSPIFNKSKLLYGYSQAKDEVYKTNQIILTEGYLDVIMLHQAGFKNAVASLGTALNMGHIPLLKKGEPEVIMAFDGDSAGVNAAFKASTLLSKNAISGKVALFGEGKDPADMVKEDKISQLKMIFEKAPTLESFVIKQIVSKYDLSNPTLKQKAYIETLEYLKTLPEFLAQNSLELLSFTLKLPFKKAQNDLFKLTKKRAFDEPKRSIGLRSLDLLEASIIKACYEKEELLEFVLDLVDESFFKNHKEEFEALLQGEKESSKLNSIVLNPIILMPDYESLKINVGKLIENRCLEDIQKLKSLNLDGAKKEFKIKEIQLKLQKLKKGEIVAYEGIGTI
ncbi:MAG: DNA primase [Campylobacterales bacterium]